MCSLEWLMAAPRQPVLFKSSSSNGRVFTPRTYFATFEGVCLVWPRWLTEQVASHYWTTARDRYQQLLCLEVTGFSLSRPYCNHSSFFVRSALPPSCLGRIECCLSVKTDLREIVKPIMILPQVHLRKPCYDFYFL